MNLSETGTVIDILAGEYGLPKNIEAESKLKVWAAEFADDPLEIVLLAVKAFIAADDRKYKDFPKVSDIKAKMRQLMEPETMTEMEAWGHVQKAMRLAPSMSADSRRFANGVLEDKTSAQRAFEGLPPIVQRIVGTPSTLAAWYLLPTDEFETVVQSNFMRSFRDRSKQERDYAAIPADVKAAIGPITERMKLGGAEILTEDAQTSTGRLLAARMGKDTAEHKNGVESVTDDFEGVVL